MTRWLLALATGVLYYATTHWGVDWTNSNGGQLLASPAMGIGVAGAILVGWPAAIVVPVAVLLASLKSNHPVGVELAVAAGHGLAVLIPVVLLRPWGTSWRGMDPTLGRTRDVLKLVLAGSLLPGGVVATVATAAVIVAGIRPPYSDNPVWSWVAIFTASAVGVIVVSPMLLTWWTDRRPLRIVPFLVCIGTTAVLAWAIFFNEHVLLRTYLVFPLLIWAAMAFRSRGASLVVVVVSVLAIWDATMIQPPAPALALMNMLAIQQFLGLSAVTVLLLAAVANERDRLQELRAAERALRGSEERLSVALNASRMGDWTWDAATDQVSLSPRAAAVFGLPMQTSITWAQLRERIHPADRTRVHQALERAASEGIDYDVEYRVQKGEGTVTWVAVRGQAVIDGASRSTGMVGVVQDITERRLAEEGVKRRASRYRFLNELAEATRDLSDSEQIMETVTRRLGTHLKVSRCAYADVEADSNRFTIRFDHTDGAPSAAGEYRLSHFGPRTVTYMRGGRTLVIRNVDTELTADAGAEMYRAVGIKALICCPLVKDGRLTALMAVHHSAPRDWHEDEIELMESVAERSWAYIERARADMALRESEERLRAIAEATPECVKIVGCDGTLMHMNTAGVAMLEADDELSLLGECIFDLIAPEDRDAWIHNHQRVCNGERLSWQFEMVGLRGTRRWMESHAVPMLMPDGAYAHLAVARDISDRKAIEQEREALLASERTSRAEAEQANAAKDQFLAVLSHELRTPLTPVLTLSQMLEQQPDVPPAVREDLSTIRRNVELEARLIDDLLDLTRIARGKLELHRETVDVHEKVRHVLEMISDEMKDRSIRLTIDTGAAHTTVRADPARLQQIIWNILKNAVKFSLPGGWIEVRTSNIPEHAGNGSAGERVRLDVRDGGIGIDPLVLPRIFDAFEQGDRTITRQFGGLGLGLAISKALVDLHHGALSATSEGIGKGATFSLELPTVATPVTEPGVAPADSGTGTNDRRLRILLVEDHEDTGRILARLLRGFGHDVERAESVESALQVADGEQFDVVLSDLGLPDGSGHDLVRALRARRPIRAVALSGFGMEEDIRKSHEAGFEEHLVKPVDLGRLEEVISRIARENGHPVGT